MTEKKSILDSARWIACEAPDTSCLQSAITPWEEPVFPCEQFMPMRDTHGTPMFRKAFCANVGNKASVTATALGVYDLWCNGQRVGTKTDEGIAYDELKPGWTDYKKRVLSLTYDISDLLVDGENVLLAVVTPGWWCGRISCGQYESHEMAFIAAITVGDNTVYTDDSWQTCHGGRIRAADIWDGEICDGNLHSYAEISKADFDHDLSGWRKPIYTEHENIEISPMIGPTVRVRKGLDRKPVTVTIYSGTKDNGSDFGEINTVATHYDTDSFILRRGEKAVVDFGQEMVGWPDIILHAEKGTAVCLRAAEMLNDSGLRSRGNDGPRGSVYTVNYRTAKAKAYYIASGNERGEEYCPSHTFFGFRYFEISANKDLEVKSLTALTVGSDIEETGSIETSHKDVNRLISNILWGQRGNYLSIPTDCPQRDERLGWTGDTQIFCNTAAYNGDVNGFFKKWLTDARDCQNPDGAYADVIPHVKVVGFGGAAWADAPIIVAHVMWKMYADTDIIKENFESLEKYMSWLESRGMEGAYTWFADWLAYEPTDGKYIAKAYYALDASLMSELCGAVGLEDKKKKYNDLYLAIRDSFRECFCDGHGDLKEEYRTQTGYLLALKTGMLDGENKQTAISSLAEKIKSNGYKLSTGFVGSGTLNQTLAEVGLNDLAYSLLLQTEDPSWLYSVHQGATTIWERWNSYTVATGFGEVSMNSFNHYAYGAVQEWMYRYMAGIETDKAHPGFEQIILQPTPDTRAPEDIPDGQERITWVRAHYNSRRGKISSEWSLSDGVFRYDAETPVTATLKLPIIGNKDFFTLNGREIKLSDCTLREGRIIMTLAAGKYSIEM